jgi:bifunctional DNA-binding transcriptional regulator/antitoxin component of YhaV-PrlF toxin-antitoxin module
MQVAIPRAFARSTGIKPGDSVIFEETPDDGIKIKKVSGASVDMEKVFRALDNLANDMTKVRGHVDEARSGLIEGLSRYVDSQR